MASPSPFEVGRLAAENQASAFRRVRDENAIERIIADSINSGDPEVLQNNIGKILSQVSPERQGSALQYLQNAYVNVQKKQEQQAQFKRESDAGLVPGINPTAQAKIYGEQAKGQRLAPYGLGGQLGKPQPGVQPGQMQPALSVNQAQPEAGQPSQEIPDQDSQSVLEKMSDQKLRMLTGHPDREISEPAKAILKGREEEGKRKKPGDEFANIREKAIADYVNSAIASGEEAENHKYSFDSVKKAIQGDISGPGVKALVKNNPYGQLLIGLTPDEALLQSANKKMLEGTKSIFGSKPTEREIFLLLNSMLPSIGKTKEANLAGLNFIERVNDLKLMHSDIVSELTNGGTKYVPDLERQVNAIMRPYGEKLRKDLEIAVEALNVVDPKKNDKESKGKISQIKVKAPDGSVGYMTQENIDKAKANNDIFTPIE